MLILWFCGWGNWGRLNKKHCVSSQNSRVVELWLKKGQAVSRAFSGIAACACLLSFVTFSSWLLLCNRTISIGCCALCAQGLSLSLPHPPPLPLLKRKWLSLTQSHSRNDFENVLNDPVVILEMDKNRRFRYRNTLWDWHLQVYQVIWGWPGENRAHHLICWQSRR